MQLGSIMKLKSTVISQFIQTNAVAYTAADKVFRSIESNTFAETLAASGVVGADIKVFATVWVAKVSDVMPHDYRGAWVFTKDSAEHSRVKYLVAVVSGAAARKAGARKSAKVDPVDAVLKAYKALTAAQKKAFIAAI
jgi:hypothetical protein